MDKILGPVTAYNYAVAGGYEGTEAEFMASVVEMINTAEDFENFSVDVAMTTPGSAPSAVYSDGHLSLVLPRGDKGEKGLTGDVGPKGDPGDPFHIVKTYASIAAMNTDYSSSAVKVGEFVMITSNVEDPDNAKVYAKGDTAFVFISDLSGSQGIQGPKGEKGETGAVPEFSIGSVTKGDTASASIEGTATNPILNLVLPKGDKGEQGEKGEKGDPGDVDQAMSDTSGIPVANRVVKKYIDDGLSAKMDDVTLAPVATSGKYEDLTGKPNLKPVAESGKYEDLSNTPNLAPVATSGRYEDLTGKPAIFSGSYNDLADKPDLKAVATSGSYNDLTDKPDIPGFVIAQDSESSAWYADETYSGYPYRATVPVEGMSTSHVPFIFFDASNADLEKLASWCVSYSGGIYIYCSENIGIVTIPTVLGIRQ